MECKVLTENEIKKLQELEEGSASGVRDDDLAGNLYGCTYEVEVQRYAVRALCDLTRCSSGGGNSDSTYDTFSCYIIKYTRRRADNEIASRIQVSLGERYASVVDARRSDVN